jgi:hypothetical protein
MDVTAIDDQVAALEALTELDTPDPDVRGSLNLTWRTTAQAVLVEHIAAHAAETADW